MARRRTRRRRRRTSSFWPIFFGIGLIVLVAVAIGLVFYWQKVLTDSHIVLRTEDHCPRDIPPSQITVLIVDSTDPLNNVQHLSVNNLLDRLVSEIPRYGAFAIYAVSTDENYRSRPVFFRCNPGRGKDIDPMLGNPNKVERQWKEGFRAPLDAELAKNLQSGSENSSPILESIQWASLQQFEPTDQVDLPHKLVIISDFLHHTKNFSHYRERPDFNTFEKSEYYRNIRANLLETEVTLWFIRRNSRVSSEFLKQFWESYIRAQGAIEVSINDLAG